MWELVKITARVSQVRSAHTTTTSSLVDPVLSEVEKELSFVCACGLVAAGGQVYSWGSDLYGQLGHGAGSSAKARAESSQVRSF